MSERRNATSDRHALIRPGLSKRLPGHLWQAGRGAPALENAAPLVDDRSQARLLSDLSAFAATLDAPGGGSWAGMLGGERERGTSGDLSFLLAEIVATEPGREYSAMRGAIGDRRTGEINAATVDTLLRLDGWYARLSRCSLEPASGLQERVREEFASIILGHRSKTSENLPALAERLKTDHPADTRLQRLEPIWTVSKDEADEAAVALGSDAVLVFSAFNSALRTLVEVCVPFFRHSTEGAIQHAPHLGLTLAFLQILDPTRARLNGLIDEHLSFYYGDVLRLAPRPAVPDETAVAFQLAPQAKSLLLPRGSRLDAGADSAGAPILFETKAELAIGHARVSQVKAVQTAWTSRRAISAGGDRDTRAIAGVFASSASCSAVGASLLPPTWTAFGDARAARGAARLGLSLRSDLLRLGGGSRRIDVVIVPASHAALAAALSGYADDLATAGIAATTAPLAGAIVVDVSTAHGFRDVAHDLTYERATGCLVVRLDLDPTFPAVCAFTESDPSVLPTLRILLDPSAPVYAYSRFADLELARIDIRVSVRELGSVSAVTQLGPVKGDKPFAPFGNPALRGGGLTVSHPELLNKNPDSIAVALHWAVLPGDPPDFAAYYGGYGRTIDDRTFRVDVAARLAQDKAVPLIPDAPVFSRDGRHRVQPIARWSVATKDLWRRSRETPAIRIRLAAPDFGFGFPLWPSLVASTAIAAAHRGAAGAAEGGQPAAPIPNLAWVPTADAITLDYEAGTSLAPGELDDDGRPGAGIFKVDAFGATIEFGKASMLPPIPTQAYLFLGLAGCRPGEALTLLFDVDARSAALSSGGDAAPGLRQRDLEVCVLDGGRWTALSTVDDTARLTKAGILSLQCPASLVPSRDPSFDKALLWLRIPSEHAPTSYGRLRGVFSNVVRVSRIINAAASPGEPRTLPPGTIAALLGRTARVAAVNQPFATSQGAAPETTRDFRVRVSERLRHKDRAVLIGDYEALVLAAFPAIGDAKCFGGADGTVTVVVAPLRHRHGSDPRPNVPEFELDAICAYLDARCASSVRRIVVRNPIYEPVKATAWMQLASQDGLADLHRLTKAVDGYIAPWIGNPDLPMSIGVPALDLGGLRTILSRDPSVRAISGLSLTHLAGLRRRAGRQMRTSRRPDDDRHGHHQAATFGYRLFDTARVGAIGVQVSPLHPCSVLVPARHDLRIVGELGIGAGAVADTFLVAAKGSAREPIPFQRAPRPAGIGTLAVGGDLLVDGVRTR